MRINEQSTTQKLKEAYDAEYIRRCPKCGSFKLLAYVDEDYFSNPLRYKCRDCKYKCGSSKFD